MSQEADGYGGEARSPEAKFQAVTSLGDSGADISFYVPTSHFLAAL